MFISVCFETFLPKITAETDLSNQPQLRAPRLPVRGRVPRARRAAERPDADAGRRQGVPGVDLTNHNLCRAKINHRMWK
jgi:hypothetical protein